MSNSGGMIIEGLKSRISEFLEEHYDDEIHDLAEDELRDELEISYEELYEFDQTIADDLSNSPEQWLTNAEAALEEYKNLEIESPQVLIKDYDKYNPAIRELRDKHLGKLVKLDGVVSKATRVLHKADVAAFECRKCGTVTKIKQPLDSDLEYPSVCSGEDCENRVERDFRINPTLSKTINFRKIEIQEPPEDVSGGQTPETLTFTVKGEIADNITAGDNVTAIGIYKASDQGDTSVFRTYMKGNNITPEDKEFEEINITDEEIERIKELASSNDVYETLRDSIAPSLYGLENEKEAVLYQLFRGVRKNELDGTTIRGDVHTLLVGDPGVGKTLNKHSIIVDKNGNHKEIGEFVEELMDNPTKDEDGDLVQEINEDVEVMAMDKDGEIEPRQVEAVWKKNVNGNSLQVELSDGRTITSSDSHPLFTTDGNAHIQQIKTGEIQEGEFIAVPREINYEGSRRNIEEDYEREYEKINPPERWSEWFAEFAGLIVSEGYVGESQVDITNEDEELLQVAKDSFKKIGIEDYIVKEKEGTDALSVSKGCKELVEFLESVDETLVNNSRGKRVPSQLYETSEDIRKAFLRAYVDGEVHVDSNGRRQFDVASMSEDLLHDVQRLLDTLGIASQVKDRKNSSAEEGVSYRLTVTGKSFDKYVEEVGFLSERKQERAEQTMEECGATNTNTDVIPDVAGVIEETRKLLGMSQHDFSVERTLLNGFEHEGKNPSRETLKTLVRDMVGKLRLLQGFEEFDKSSLTWSVVDDYRQFASLSQKEVAEEMDLTQTGYGYNVNNNADSGGQKTVQAFETVQEKIEDDLHRAHENLIRLESLAWGDIRWVKVDSIEEVEFEDEWFFDLQVEGTHNYIANGIMSHNSQLLRYASQLSPRGIMTSGKGATAAGLCVGPDTEVRMNGEGVEISDVVDERIDGSVSTPTAVEVDGVETRAVEYEEGVVSSDVRYLWKMPEQEAVEVELEDGRSVTVSENTPLVTGYSDGSYGWTDARDVEVGMEVGTFSDELDESLDEVHEVRWSEVVSVSSVETELYDMTTDVGNFYASGIVVHNTAAAVRDAEFGGEDKWTLQAGALVLADQGLACVDEIDKMDASDRSSMHEGLEQQTISVAKAGINATLKSRCTLLAAANPKDGRWNEFDPVPAQIDLEPALVSRFDMIFAPEDKRTDERDNALADHILTTNLRGQQLAAGEEPEEDTEEVEPEVDVELFKKYVAYARQNCNPVMTEEAREHLQQFFVEIRSEGEQEGAIPVTARKIEGLVRISEAAARVQLSDTVEKRHAERAINIVMESLKDVGYDEEAGRFDVDMTETNQSTTQRNRRNVLKEVIEENEDEGEQGAPKDLVIEIMVEEHGYEEDEVDYDLRKMGREGKEVYEPKTNEFATM